jgi:hypothetical protein
MINERQKDLIDRLNDMYHSQNLEYRNRYADNYFALLDHIMTPYNPNKVEITGEDVIRFMNRRTREWLESKKD